MTELMGLPELRDAQAQTVSTAAVYQPGAIFVHRNGSNWGLIQYVQLDNNGCSQGDSLVTNYATIVSYSVAKASTDDQSSRPFRGVACATVASQRFGFMYIGGYVEKADCSYTVASGDFLYISGSTAGKLTPLPAGPHPIAVARGAFATGVGSVSLIGVWG